VHARRIKRKRKEGGDSAGGGRAMKRARAQEATQPLPRDQEKRKNIPFVASGGIKNHVQRGRWKLPELRGKGLRPRKSGQKPRSGGYRLSSQTQLGETGLPPRVGVEKTRKSGGFDAWLKDEPLDLAPSSKCCGTDWQGRTHTASSCVKRAGVPQRPVPKPARASEER